MPTRVDAEAALNQLGIDFMPDSYTSLTVQAVHGAHSAALLSPDGNADIVVHDFTLGQNAFERGYQNAASLIREQAPYTLRGLLPFAIGFTAVHSALDDRPRLIQVTAQPSPDGYNSMLEQLELEPGVDTFKIVRLSDREYLLAGDQIDAHARMEHYVARVGSLPGTHDTKPSQHGQFMFATPVSVCHAIQQSALRLQARLGSDIFLQPETRTPSGNRKIYERPR